MDTEQRSQVTHNHAPAARILLASTLTVHSDRALDRACMIAKSLDAELIAVHAVDPGILPERYVMEHVDSARAFLQRELDDSVHCDGVRASADVLLGTAEQVIGEYAAESGIGLIVTGVSRDLNLTSAFAGTRIEKVVRAAHCPVLVVKRRPRAAYSRIVVAMDLQPASRHAFDFALRNFPSAQFTVLHAGISESAAGLVEDVVVSRCTAAGHPVPGAPGGPEIVIFPDQAANSIQQEIMSIDPDLVVLGTHGRSGMARLFVGSVAGTLLEVLPHDTLIARAPEDRA
jgi:nucleotide-binding universal stress UspA family protein